MGGYGGQVLHATRETPRLLAVIDVGSHAVRLVIAEAPGDNSWRVLESFWNPVTLGNDIFSRGVVRHSSLATVVTILQQYREVLSSWKISEPCVVASSTLAGASNAETCIERIESATGFRLNLLEPADEALAILRACLRGGESTRLATGTTWLLVARSGLTQSVVLKDGVIMLYGAHDDGALRFSRNFDLPESDLERVLPFVLSQPVQSIKSWCGIEQIDRCVAVSEDISGLLDRVRDTTGVSHDLTADEFGELRKSVLACPQEEMASRWGLDGNRAVTIRIGLLVIGMLFEQSGAGRIIFPPIHLTSAVVDALVRTEGGFPDLLRDGFEGEILEGAHAIGRKFKYDEAHARECERIAGLLYDQLAQSFQPRERLLVRVAAILHDIGMYIGSKGHHRYSAELVAASDILGLSACEVQEVSWTVRFHRKGLPGGTAIGYKAMDRSARLAVFRMAAILRLADALSEPGLPRIEAISIRFGESAAILSVGLEGKRYEFLEIMRVLLNNKKQYFEHYFGTDLVLERLRTVDGP